MPTDTLVDVVTLIKLVNVRKSLAEEAGKLAGDMLGADDAIWDMAELGPLQLIGDDQALPHGAARQIKEKPVEETETGEVSVPSPSGTYVIDKEGRAHPEGRVPVPAPAKKVVVAPPPAHKKYARLPSDFDERTIAYLLAHPGCNLSDLSRHFTAHIKTVYPHLESLVKQGRITKIKQGPSKMAPVKYYPYTKPPEKAVEQKPAEPKPAAVPAAAEQPKEPVVSPHVIESFKGMRTGSDKDSDIKNSILKILEKSPGVGTNEIYHEVGKNVAHLARVRKLLVELEEEREIAPVKVPGQFGPRTGYYLKAAVPKEAM